MALGVTLNDLFNEFELKCIMDYSNSDEYKPKGFRPINCYASEIYDMELSMSKVELVTETVMETDSNHWKFDVVGEMKQPTLHKYEIGKSLPLNKLTFQTHRNVDNDKGFQWHYDAVDVGSKIK